MRIAIARYIRCPDNYFFDLFDAVAAGTLSDAGHTAVVVERVLSDSLQEEDLLEGMISFLDDFAPDLVFLPYLPTQELARRVKQCTAAQITVFGSRIMLESRWVDFVIAEPDPLACLELVEALSSEREFGTVAALSWQVDGETITSEKPLHPMEEIFKRGRIDYDAFFRLGPHRPYEVRKHIAGDWGCTYRNAAPDNGAGSIPGCPSFAATGGCTFCSRPRSNVLPWEAKEKILGYQLDEVLAAFPALNKLIVIDEYALSFVDELARLVSSRPLQGVEILVSGRLDHVERHRHRLEFALELLEGRNSLRLYQFGIENFSDSVLRRYNKGMDYAGIRAACRLILDMVDRFDNLGIERSFGLILFDPWTTVDELRENVERAREIDLPRFRDQAPFTSLRLHPEVPLYWKARQDGLLTGHIDDDSFGYSVNSGWSFQHPDTAAVWRELANRRGSKEPWPLLEEILRDR